MNTDTEAQPYAGGIVREFAFVLWEQDRNGAWRAGGSYDSVRDARRNASEHQIIMRYGVHPTDPDAREIL